MLMLVIVNGKPLGNYLQTLMVLCLLLVELLYQLLWHPYWSPQVQMMQAAAVVIVLFSGFSSLFLHGYVGEASAGGLDFVGIGMGVMNVAFFAFVLFWTCRAYACLEAQACTEGFSIVTSTF